MHIPELLQDTDEHHKVRIDDHRIRVALLQPFEKVVRHPKKPSKRYVVLAVYALISIVVHLAQYVNSVDIVLMSRRVFRHESDVRS